MTDSPEKEQLIATFFHQSRADAKAQRKAAGKPPATPVHHRANTDWWNHAPGGRKR